MRTIVYVVGFNLYYGALKDTPYKWLDLPLLFKNTLRPHRDKVSQFRIFQQQERLRRLWRSLPKQILSAVRSLYASALSRWADFSSIGLTRLKKGPFVRLTFFGHN